MNKFKNQGCSQKFFSGVDIKQVEGSISTAQISKSDFLEPAKPSENGNSSKTIGCVSMQLVYKQESNPLDGNLEFTFQAEVAMRNDKVGLIAWAGGDLQKNSIYLQTIKYRIIFLEYSNDA